MCLWLQIMSDFCSAETLLHLLKLKLQHPEMLFWAVTETLWTLHSVSDFLYIEQNVLGDRLIQKSRQDEIRLPRPQLVSLSHLVLEEIPARCVAASNRTSPLLWLHYHTRLVCESSLMWFPCIGSMCVCRVKNIRPSGCPLFLLNGVCINHETSSNVICYVR